MQLKEPPSRMNGRFSLRCLAILLLATAPTLAAPLLTNFTLQDLTLDSGTDPSTGGAVTISTGQTGSGGSLRGILLDGAGGISGFLNVTGNANGNNSVGLTPGIEFPNRGSAIRYDLLGISPGDTITFDYALNIPVPGQSEFAFISYASSPGNPHFTQLFATSGSGSFNFTLPGFAAPTGTFGIGLANANYNRIDTLTITNLAIHGTPEIDPRSSRLPGFLLTCGLLVAFSGRKRNSSLLNPGGEKTPVGLCSPPSFLTLQASSKRRRSPARASWL